MNHSYPILFLDNLFCSDPYVLQNLQIDSDSRTRPPCSVATPIWPMCTDPAAKITSKYHGYFCENVLWRSKVILIHSQHYLTDQICPFNAQDLQGYAYVITTDQCHSSKLPSRSIPVMGHLYRVLFPVNLFYSQYHLNYGTYIFGRENRRHIDGVFSCKSCFF